MRLFCMHITFSLSTHVVIDYNEGHDKKEKVTYMNISILTASFPVDALTYSEVQALLTAANEADGKHYDNTLHIYAAQQADVQGFYVLAYDDEADRLVAVASAIDEVGFHTFEWSLVVDPLYRQIGVGTAMFDAMQQALAMRQSAGDLAVVVEGAPFGQTLVEKHQYTYSFSEATFEAAPQQAHALAITLRPYDEDEAVLIELYADAFGDTAEESQQLIDYNLQREGTDIWLAEHNGQIVGTVTTTVMNNERWITAFATKKELRGQGFGQAVLEHVKHDAAIAQNDIVLLDVETENVCALAVYEKAGFIKTAQLDYFAK